jgi:hypothetical protein
VKSISRLLCAMLLILQEVEIMSSSPSQSKLRFLMDENVHRELGLSLKSEGIEIIFKTA